MHLASCFGINYNHNDDSSPPDESENQKPEEKYTSTFNYNFMNKRGKLISAESKKFKRELAKQNKTIERELKKSEKEYNSTIRLLLLGPGESGKSTVLKQMRLIHSKAYTAEEKYEALNSIREFTRNSMISILRAMNKFDMDFDGDNQASLEAARQYLFEHETLYSDSDCKSEHSKFWDYISDLWKCDTVRQVAYRGTEYHLSDSACYFFDRAQVFRDEKYILTDQDILRLRVLTTGIVETKFSTHGINFHIFDVGGQRDQRKKWIQCFDDVTAIIFIADISSFNRTLAEDNTTNRLVEALTVFNQIWNNRYLYHVSIILFLNKYDTFTEKITANVKLDEYFPAYSDYRCPEEINQNFIVPGENEEVTRAKMFVLEEFINITRNVPTETRQQARQRYRPSIGSGQEEYNKFCMPYFTCAVDTENIRRVFKSCRSILRKENIIKSGLM